LISLVLALVRYNSTMILSGDVPGFIASVYTDLIGQYFSGAILFTLFTVSYIRTQDITFGAILWIILAGSLEIMIPTTGFNVAKLFIVMGIASALLGLYNRSKRK